MIDRRDAEFLLARAEFRRFLYEVIQTSGLLCNTVAADGRTIRDQCLEWHEGRRSLGHEILLMVEQGQPEALRSPDGTPIATIAAVLRDAINPKETNSDRSRKPARSDDDGADERYSDLD